MTKISSPGTVDLISIWFLWYELHIAFASKGFSPQQSSAASTPSLLPLSPQALAAQATCGGGAWKHRISQFPFRIRPRLNQTGAKYRVEIQDQEVVRTTSGGVRTQLLGNSLQNFVSDDEGSRRVHNIPGIWHMNKRKTSSCFFAQVVQVLV